MIVVPLFQGDDDDEPEESHSQHAAVTSFRTIATLRRLKQEEMIDIAWFGGARSGTDAAKLVGLGVNAIGYGVAAALALGGEITPTGMRFAPDRTEEERASKDSLLFIHLLYRLKRIYRRARRIVLIVDNSTIHKSSITRRRLANNPKFELFFQPVYYPWVNVIELLWKTLHDTVTRNHRHRSMKALMGSARRFMQACQPWPGSAHALAKA